MALEGPSTKPGKSPCKGMSRGRRAALTLLAAPTLGMAGCEIAALTNQNRGEFLAPNAITYKRPTAPDTCLLFVSGSVATPLKFRKQAQTIANAFSPKFPNMEFRFYRLETCVPGEEDKNPRKLIDFCEGWSNHILQNFDPTTQKVTSEIAEEINHQVKLGRKVTLLAFSEGAVISWAIVNKVDPAHKDKVSAVFFSHQWGAFRPHNPNVPYFEAKHPPEIEKKLGGESHWFEHYFKEPKSREALLDALRKAQSK